MSAAAGAAVGGGAGYTAGRLARPDVPAAYGTAYPGPAWSGWENAPSGRIGSAPVKPRGGRLRAVLIAVGVALAVLGIAAGVYYFLFRGDGQTHSLNRPLTALLPGASAGFTPQAPRNGSESLTLDQIAENFSDDTISRQDFTDNNFKRAAERVLVNSESQKVVVVDLLQFGSAGGAKDFFKVLVRDGRTDSTLAVAPIDVTDTQRFQLKDTSDGQFAEVAVTRVGDIVAVVSTISPGGYDGLLTKVATANLRKML